MIKMVYILLFVLFFVNCSTNNIEKAKFLEIIDCYEATNNGECPNNLIGNTITKIVLKNNSNRTIWLNSRSDCSLEIYQRRGIIDSIPHNIGVGPFMIKEFFKIPLETRQIDTFMFCDNSFFYFENVKPKIEDLEYSLKYKLNDSLQSIWIKLEKRLLFIK